MIVVGVVDSTVGQTVMEVVDGNLAHLLVEVRARDHLDTVLALSSEHAANVATHLHQQVRIEKRRTFVVDAVVDVLIGIQFTRIASVEHMVQRGLILRKVTVVVMRVAWGSMQVLVAPPISS